MPWEDAVDEAYERKILRYVDLSAKVEQRGWLARVRPVEGGCRGFVGKAMIGQLAQSGIHGKSFKEAVKAMSEAAREASEWLWMRRIASWGSK